MIFSLACIKIEVSVHLRTIIWTINLGIKFVFEFVDLISPRLKTEVEAGGVSIEQ